MQGITKYSGKMAKGALIVSAIMMAPLSAWAKEVHPWTIGNLLVPVTIQDYMKMRFGHGVVTGEPVSSVEHVIFAGVAFVIALLLAAATGRALRKRMEDPTPAPKFTLSSFVELILDAAINIMTDLSGRERAVQFLPLIGSLGVFILVSNLLGLIPGFAPATDNWNTNVAMASVVFVYYHYMGFKYHGVGYLKEFMGPIIKWYALPLIILMFAIEMISHFARPLSLSIRLLGNIFGDHTVVWSFVGMAPILVPVPFVILGMFVAFVQAFVFCALSAVYLHMATIEEEV